MNFGWVNLSLCLFPFCKKNPNKPQQTKKNPKTKKQTKKPNPKQVGGTKVLSYFTSKRCILNTEESWNSGNGATALLKIGSIIWKNGLKI